MENLIVAVIIVIAGLYAFRNFYKSSKKGGGCGCGSGCSACSVSADCNEEKTDNL